MDLGSRRLSMAVVFCMIFQVIFAGLLGSNHQVHASAVEGNQGPNLIPNGGFEEGTLLQHQDWVGGRPDGWSAWLPTRNGQQVSVVNNQSHLGSRSVEIKHQAAARTAVAPQPITPVLPGLAYTVQAWLKTQDVKPVDAGKGVYIRTQFCAENGSKLMDGPAIPFVKGSTEWTLHEMKIEVPKDPRITRLKVEILLETGTGTVWIDDVSLTETGSDLPAQAFDTIRQRWASKLVGGEGVQMNDPDAAANVSALVERMTNGDKTGRWDTLNKGDHPDSLWDGVISKTQNDSWRISWAYGIIRDLALAYSIEGSPLYGNEALKNDIVRAMKWMYEYQYNPSKKITGNWWDWEIGTPQEVMNILVLMHDVMPPELLNQYLAAIDKFVPDPKKRVANPQRSKQEQTCWIRRLLLLCEASWASKRPKSKWAETPLRMNSYTSSKETACMKTAPWSSTKILPTQEVTAAYCLAAWPISSYCSLIRHGRSQIRMPVMSMTG